MAGIGIYWCIVEMLYGEGGYLPLSDCDFIADELKMDKEVLKDIISNSGLFKVSNGQFYSEAALRRLEERKVRAEAAKRALEIRWERERQKRGQAKPYGNTTRNTERNKERLEDLQLSDNFRELISELLKLPGWGEGQLVNDAKWLSEFLTEYRESPVPVTVSLIRACRDWHLARHPKTKNTKGYWKSRLRNWMEFAIKQERERNGRLSKTQHGRSLPSNYTPQRDYSDA